MLKHWLLPFFILLNIVCFSQKPATHSKLAYSYQAFQRGTRSNDSISFSVSFSGKLLPGSLKQFAEIVSLPHPSVVIVKTSHTGLEKMLALDEVIFVSPLLTAKEELTTGAYDLSLNSISFLHSKIPQLTGEGIHVSVKERLFDTTDIDLKDRIIITGKESPEQTVHASLMATMIAGGANSSSYAQGIAWSSNVSSASFANLFPEPDSMLLHHNISVQNHSYGTLVENFYGNEARAYDMQMNGMPHLIHVFSAGNSGNVTSSAGPYAGVQNVANLTGNFKQSKNSISVGSVDSTGSILPLGSRGPAFDGRIKPELVAYGEDGSSGAAATVSGAAALIQHAFLSKHGVFPPSSLVKASLLNSADDAGISNVDYQSGFGNLNAYKAVSTVSENRYLVDTIHQNEIKTFPLVVPPGISKLRITIAWNDPAAAPNAVKALVNDLDLLLRLPPTAQSWLPWVLDPSPDVIALQAPAVRKRDTLNNVEQITVDAPPAGTYEVEVKSSALVNPSQPFSFVFQLDTADNFQWTYPTVIHPLVKGNIQWLRWQTTISGNGYIEYATGNNNWREVGTVALSSGYFRWQVPDTITSAVLRMRLPGGSVLLSDTFTISPELQLQVGFNCADSFLLYWRSFDQNSFELYELDDLYLQPFSQVTDSFRILDKLSHPSLYYAVAPVINGRRGIRSGTINYASAAPGCYIVSFFLKDQTAASVTFSAELGTLYNVSTVTLEKRTGNTYQSVEVINNPVTTMFDLVSTSLVQGENHFRLKLTLANGTVLYSNVETVYHLPVQPVIFYPNPVLQSGTLNIITNESGRYTLRLFDMTGRLAYTQLLTSTVTKINASFFSRGLYIARIIDRDGKPFSSKVIIQ